MLPWGTARASRRGRPLPGADQLATHGGKCCDKGVDGKMKCCDEAWAGGNKMDYCDEDGGASAKTQPDLAGH